MQTNEQATDFVDTKTITLRKPVTIGIGDKAKLYEILALREPTAGELGKVSRASSDVAGLLLLVSLVAEVPLDVAASLCSRDLDEANDFLSNCKLPEPQEDDGVDFIDEITIDLRKPVSIGSGDKGIVYSTLDLREPIGREKEKASREPTDTLTAIALISTVAKVPRLVIERLCRRDFEEACYFLGSCRITGRRTGGT